jgi:glycerol dehydrogenase
MSNPTRFLPEDIFAPRGDRRSQPPMVLGAPSRYIQGEDVLDELGRYLALVPSTCAAIYISAGGERREGARLRRSLSAAGIEARFVTFGGECSADEIASAVQAANANGRAIDCLIAVGGGKCIDAGKSVAWRLGVPMVSCPSLASNDAPCSAISVLYTPEGVTAGLEFFPRNPVLVVVDTRIVAEAPVRYLVAGMGDAMATWFEARTCLENPYARSALAARPTLAAAALGELCANTLFADGVAAAAAVRERSVTPALDHVVEANTLLSGIGFESGGLACAHAVAQGLTVLPHLHKDYMHGEMVAIGLLTQLILEARHDEAVRVATFFAEVGLPAHLGHIALASTQTAELTAAMEGALTLPFLANEPFAVTPAMLVTAAQEADALGREVVAKLGDEPYRRLHGYAA